MIYLDTSALAKLVFEEPETIDLEHWLVLADERMATSVLGRVELLRACRRARSDSAAAAARVLLADLTMVPLTDTVMELAEDVGPGELRSPHALHLASTLTIGEALSGFVVYDKRLRDAAVLAELPAMSPGVG
jgi:uncharacterized protein